jgi:hypothetical protein
MSMNINQKHFRSQIEITNLIEEAVANASARRNKVVEEDSLSELSEEEKKNITGGGILDRIIIFGGYLLG